MRFDPVLRPATLLRRYKRFLADVVLENGTQLTVHTPNTGSMLGCAEPGSRVWIRDTGSDTRKYRFSWDISEPRPGTLVGVHTGFANNLVKEAIECRRIAELSGYTHIRREVAYGRERSRVDLRLEHASRPHCYVEVKNVTAEVSEGEAIFPDAVTARGTRHLRELAAMVEAGYRAVLFFCIQRDDIRSVRAADEIDPEYAQTLQWAVHKGVEVLAYRSVISPNEICLAHRVEVMI